MLGLGRGRWAVSQKHTLIHITDARIRHKIKAEIDNIEQVAFTRLPCHIPVETGQQSLAAVYLCALQEPPWWRPRHCLWWDRKVVVVSEVYKDTYNWCSCTAIKSWFPYQSPSWLSLKTQRLLSHWSYPLASRYRGTRAKYEKTVNFSRDIKLASLSNTINIEYNHSNVLFIGCIGCVETNIWTIILSKHIIFHQGRRSTSEVSCWVS